MRRVTPGSKARRFGIQKSFEGVLERWGAQLSYEGEIEPSRLRSNDAARIFDIAGRPAEQLQDDHVFRRSDRDLQIIDLNAARPFKDALWDSSDPDEQVNFVWTARRRRLNPNHIGNRVIRIAGSVFETKFRFAERGLYIVQILRAA